MDIINDRRSIRTYNDEVISDDIILEIIKASMQAPSARNEQPWEFLVIKDKTKLETISNEFNNIKMAKDASFVIVYLFNEEKIICPNYFVQDMASSITTGLLKATSLKIGSCWCGIYPNMDRVNGLRKILNINEEKLVPFGLVTFGYPKDSNAFRFIDRFDESKIHYGEI